jgi:hypothetical protein
MAAMTKLLTFTELEDLVRSDPELDADEALEYGGWHTEPPPARPARRRRMPGRLRLWRGRRRPRAGKG